jgi:REP element-mobilizing transposase RayT
MRGNDSRTKYVVQALSRIRERYGFLLVGYVVMPEHVYLLIGESLLPCLLHG